VIDCVTGTDPSGVAAGAFSTVKAGSGAAVVIAIRGGLLVNDQTGGGDGG